MRAHWVLHVANGCAVDGADHGASVGSAHECVAECPDYLAVQHACEAQVAHDGVLVAAGMEEGHLVVVAYVGGFGWMLAGSGWMLAGLWVDWERRIWWRAVVAIAWWRRMRTGVVAVRLAVEAAAAARAAAMTANLV